MEYVRFKSNLAQGLHPTSGTAAFVALKRKVGGGEGGEWWIVEQFE